MARARRASPRAGFAGALRRSASASARKSPLRRGFGAVAPPPPSPLALPPSPGIPEADGKKAKGGRGALGACAYRAPAWRLVSGGRASACVRLRAPAGAGWLAPRAARRALLAHLRACSTSPAPHRLPRPESSGRGRRAVRSRRRCRRGSRRASMHAPKHVGLRPSSEGGKITGL